MPTYYVIDGVKIQFFFNDHLPPHFHASLAEYDALIDVNSLEVIRGELPSKKLKKILKWAKENQIDLQELWLHHRDRE